MDRPIVAVITGASSGIGRATALEFARHGASMALAARSGVAMEELAARCGSLGGRTISVPLDVSDEGAVRELARKTAEWFGRIDVWVNNASVTAFGRLEELPSEVCRRIVEVNLLGYIHGARAVLPHFREQGRGTLIHVSSVAGKTGEAYTSVYSATKAGMIGLANSLRQELYDAPEIHVCTVLPASIDTPIFQHGANYAGRQVKPLEPVYPPEQVAEAIFELTQHPQREVVVGGAGKLMLMLHKRLPALTERLYARQNERDHFEEMPADPFDGSEARCHPASDKPRP